MTTESTAAMTNQNCDVLLERVENICSDGKWNGRAEIVFWKDRYYMPFRSASEHECYDTQIRMLISDSTQPKGWTPDAGIDAPNVTAEAHILATPDRLFAYLALQDPATPQDEPIRTLYTHSDDGLTWSEPVLVYEKDFSFWKPVTHGGVHYVAADIMTDNPRVELLQSQDGMDWQKISTIVEGDFTETALLFLKDNTLVAFVRQGRVALSRPPYTAWSVHDCPVLHGPAATLVGDTILVSGRVFTENYPDDQPGRSRTGLFVFDPETLQFHWQMNMLAQWGGDESYPDFLTLDDRRALMVWYTGELYEKGVPKQADLLLATLRLQ